MAELWGVDYQPKIEKFHDKFCRTLLGAPKNTSKTMMHLEINEISNSHRVNRKVIRYLIKINVESENSLVKQLYNIDQCKERY